MNSLVISSIFFAYKRPTPFYPAISTSLLFSVCERETEWERGNGRGREKLFNWQSQYRLDWTEKFQLALPSTASILPQPLNIVSKKTDKMANINIWALPFITVGQKRIKTNKKDSLHGGEPYNGHNFYIVKQIKNITAAKLFQVLRHLHIHTYIHESESEQRPQ